MVTPGRPHYKCFAPVCCSHVLTLKVLAFRISLENKGLAASLYHALKGLYCPMLLSGATYGDFPLPAADLLSKLEASLESLIAPSGKHCPGDVSGTSSMPKGKRQS